MKKLNVYLNFNGKCEEALNFYKTAFNGEISFIHRFSESPMNSADVDGNKIMHSEFNADGIYFMASDGMPGQTLQTGNQVSLSIALNDETEQTKLFNNLSLDGTVIMPLQDTYWDARFGIIIDKYGITWMLNVEKKK